MSNNYDSKKPAKSNPPFYFIEGKGWYIDTKVKTEQGYKHMRVCYYPTLSLARNDFSNQVELFRAKYGKSKDERANCKWSKFTAIFLDYRRTQIKGSSLAVDKGHIKIYTDVVGSETPVKECFSRQAAAEIQKAVMKKNVSRNHKNKIISLYRVMAQFAYDKEYIDDDRPVRSETYRIAVSEEAPSNKREKIVISEADEEKLIQAIGSPTDKMLVLTLFNTGLRIGEALALTPSDFDPIESEVSITKTVSTDEDNHKKVFQRTKTPLGTRKIPLSYEFMSIVASYVTHFKIAPNGLLFPSYERYTSVMDASAFRKRLTMYCEMAGIKDFSPHSIRHTYATRLSGKCHNDAERQARAYMLGHSVTVDEAIYTAHNQLQTAKALIK